MLVQNVSNVYYILSKNILMILFDEFIIRVFQTCEFEETNYVNQKLRFQKNSDNSIIYIK